MGVGVLCVLCQGVEGGASATECAAHLVAWVYVHLPFLALILVGLWL